MKIAKYPFVNMPNEFVTLLKSNLSVMNSPAPIFDIIRPNQAIYMVLENAFREFDDGRGIEKVMLALGWPNFRDRLVGIYIYKSIYGDFPSVTSMEWVDEIKELEVLYSDHAVHGYSRLLLLGFYLKLASLEIQRKENNNFLDFKIPPEVGPLLKLSHGRSEKIDWLVLILGHLCSSLGDKIVANALVSGKKLRSLYELMTIEAREMMFHNLMAYGASINEAELFLYEKV